MSEKLSLAKREKDIRHQRNLAGYSGFWHGAYYLLGRVKLPKEKIKGQKGNAFFCGKLK